MFIFTNIYLIPLYRCVRIYIYIYIYILSTNEATDDGNIYMYIYIRRQTISLYHSTSVRLDSRSWARNPADSYANRRFYRAASRKLD